MRRLISTLNFSNTDVIIGDQSQTPIYPLIREIESLFLVLTVQESLAF